MASNAEISESLTTLEDVGYPRDEESESERRDDEAGSEQQEKESVEAAKHPFSEPWEESDLILAVEEETFHVHRQIMSIHSPVFKAMLKSVGIKEDMATEIPLPGKKADEFLDFLKILYLKEKEGIELNKMGHILKLADDYKVEGVHDFCSKMLRDLPKAEDNAVKVFFLSTQTLMAREDDRLEPVRSQCKSIVKDMDLVDIQGSGVLKKLNKDACESLLVERIKRLETHVTQVYPQFVGLADYCLHLGLKCSLPGLVKCPEHFINPKVNTALPERIVSCSYCKKMINQLVQLSLESEGHEHVYGGEHHFNSDLISILKNFTIVMGSLQRKTSLGAAHNLLIAGTTPFEAKTHATSPLCDSKPFTETVKSGSVGLPPPAATPAIQALPSPIVGNEAYQSSEVQFGNVAPGPPTTASAGTSGIGSSLFGSTASTGKSGIGSSLFGSTASTGKSGIGSSLFGSTASTGTSGIGSSLFGSTANTGTSGTGSSLFGSTASTGTSGTGSSLFGSTASTEKVGIGNFAQQSFTSTSASKSNSGFFPLNSRGKGKRT